MIEKFTPFSGEPRRRIGLKPRDSPVA